jgi:hypothetical protein
LQTRQAGLRQSVLRQRCNSAPRFGLLQKIMRVKVVTFECNEQITRFQAARIGVHTHEVNAAITDQLVGIDPAKIAASDIIA